MNVGNTILSQIPIGVKMAIGFHDPFLSRKGSDEGVTFQIKVLPFLKSGKRSRAPRKIRCDIHLNGLDYYDISVGYVNKDLSWTTHFEAKNIDAQDLGKVLLALDYDGPEVTNPRYWTV